MTHPSLPKSVFFSRIMRTKTAPMTSTTVAPGGVSRDIKRNRPRTERTTAKNVPISIVPLIFLENRLPIAAGMVIRTNPNTVNRYLEVIFASKLVDKCMRFDISGKKALKTHYKTYVADISLYTSYPNRRHDIQMGHLLENIVFNELNSRGYDVQVGKLRDCEADFVVSDGRHTAYIQVTYLMDSQKTEEREETPFFKIRDNYPKYIISMDPVTIDRFGIIRLHLVNDFLLGDGFKF